MTLHVWTKDKNDMLLKLHSEGLTNKEKAERMTEYFGEHFSKEGIKKRIQRMNKKPQEHNEYKETIEINSDGSHRSDKLLRMSAEQCKDVVYLLNAHGYDKNAWELVSARSNIWNAYSKQDGVQTMYSSKITVKPKIDNDFNKLIEEIRNQKPIVFNQTKHALEKNYLLEISPVDTHFGISNYEYYIPNQQRILEKIKSKHWSEVVIPIGNDLFHNDDFRGRTSSGREIQKVSMNVAWNEAKRFYYPIIEQAIKYSNKTKVIYVKGNHDESMSWAFVDNTQTKFPQIECDIEFQEHKAHIFNGVFLGYTHGDKNRKNAAKIFNSKFRSEIAKAKVREIHLAHLHGEDASTKDDYGIMVRTLPTMNIEDEWHDQNGYVGKNKRFQLFEYSEEALESIHYV